MIFIYITCKNKKEARKIGLFLVQKRLAACCNIFPIESIYPVRNFTKIQTHHPKSHKISNGVYWRRGKIAKDKEVVLIVKTLKKNFKKIEKEVKRLHSYKIPCIVSLNCDKVYFKYLNWLKSEIK